jgi:hypothetical protein
MMSDEDAHSQEVTERKWEEAEELWLGGAKKLILVGGMGNFALEAKDEGTPRHRH